MNTPPVDCSGKEEVENAKLKRLYADLAVENAAIREVLNRKG